MQLYPSERVGVFIDGYHIYSVAKGLGGEIDYKELHRYFSSRSYLVRAYYFGISVDDAEYVATRPLTDWLQYNGYSVHLRTVRHSSDTNAILRERARLDVDMTVQVMTASETLDHVVLITGEEAFVSLVKALKKRGKIATVISTLHSETSSVSDQLRRTADNFVDIGDLKTVLNIRHDGAGAQQSNSRGRRSRNFGPEGTQSSSQDVF